MYHSRSNWCNSESVRQQSSCRRVKDVSESVWLPNLLMCSLPLRCRDSDCERKLVNFAVIRVVKRREEDGEKDVKSVLLLMHRLETNESECVDSCVTKAQVVPHEYSSSFNSSLTIEIKDAKKSIVV